MTIIDCTGKQTREINREIRSLIAGGETEVHLRNPGARHNLAVGILTPVKIVVEGSAGYYCGGMGDGPNIEINGSAGWGVAECMMSGTVTVQGSAGNGAGASMRGGKLVLRGNAAARAGVSLKGGTVIIGGDAGYMTGFMAQKGTIIILGDAGEALGDSMYEAQIFVAGRITDLGNDTVVQQATAAELVALSKTLAGFGLPEPGGFQKVVSGRKLWNFDKKDLEVWREAL